MLGQIGLPGGGFGHGYGSMRHRRGRRLRLALPGSEGRTRCARSSRSRASPTCCWPRRDLRVRRGGTPIPDIRLVHWAGGNPFHHHQDLGRLRRALARPDTVVVNEPYWTAMARHADIVVPATTTLERNDIGGRPNDPTRRDAAGGRPAVGEARDDYEIFAEAGRARSASATPSPRAATSGLAAPALRRLGERSRRPRVEAPNFETSGRGVLRAPRARRATSVLFDAFRADPEADPLRRPAGRSS